MNSSKNWRSKIEILGRGNRVLYRFPCRASLAVTLIIALLVAGLPEVLAVHDDGLFELDYQTSPTVQGDANTWNDLAKPGDDWNQIYCLYYPEDPACVDVTPPTAFASAFIDDFTGGNEQSFFTGGGSKDERPISSGSQHWAWDNTNDVIPDKDDIDHAFAAAYEEPGTGHTIVYFGLDRFDTDGSAEVGFWFFRNQVTLGDMPNFEGEHAVGDILVLAEFVSGGTVGNVNVYRWVGGKNPLTEVTLTGSKDCSEAAANDPVCAVVNNPATEPDKEIPAWDYVDKDGHEHYEVGALFEGGIDLDDILFADGNGDGDIGCFSSFMAETRSAHSLNAQLKDFALGSFPFCRIEVQKTGDTLSKVGDPVNYTITIANTGRATLYKYNIHDDKLGAITSNGVDQVNPNVIANGCGASLAPKATCTITLRRSVDAADPDPLTNTVTILYMEREDFTGMEFSSSAEHTVELFQPAVTIAKTGDELSKITDPVNYNFTIRNMSSQDSPDLALVSISDNVIGDLMGQATAAGCDILTYNEECSFRVARAVLDTDPDPLVNTVDVRYHPDGFPNDIIADDSHSVNLFQPEVAIEKSGDTLSKVGDEVIYHFKMINTSSQDSPNLILDSIVDDVLGNLMSQAATAGCVSLPPDDPATPTVEGTCEFDIPWTVTAVDLHGGENGGPDGEADDPVINTATIHFHPDGFPNDITATGSHELNLFQPSIAFGKSADTDLSKVGDIVNYTLALNNTSSPDSPVLECMITDTLLGLDGYEVILPPGAGWSQVYPYTIKAEDPDPLMNSASVSCQVRGFSNMLDASSGWSVNLFQPSVEVVKNGPPLSKIGDEVTYHFKITNNSSVDTPNLILDSISDDILDNLLPPPACANLAPGAFCEFTVPWTVADDSADPVVNIVTVHYHPSGFTNDIVDTDSHSLNLFQPAIELTKRGDALSKIGDMVNYVITLYNNSSPDTPNMECTVTDDKVGVNEVFNVASGAHHVINVTGFIIPSDAADPFENTATVTCSPAGFPNIYTDEATWSTELFQPSIVFEKTGHDYSKAGDTINYIITLDNTSSDDSPNLTCRITDPLLEIDQTINLAWNAANYVINASRLVMPGDADPLINTAHVLCKVDDFGNELSASAEHAVDLLHPDFTITKDCLNEPVPTGGSAIFGIIVANTGDVALDFVLDEEANWYDRDPLPDDDPAGPPANFALVSGETFFTLDDGESQAFEIAIVADSGPIVENIVNATATLPEIFGLDNVLETSANATCNVVGGATRTPGFWKTHVDYTIHILNEHFSGVIDLGWKELDSPEDIFGMFWANPAKDAEGDKRGKICQAQVQGSYQLLAAILNTGLDNGAPVPTDPVTNQSLIAAMQDALKAGIRPEILRLAALLDLYNNSGDDVALIDNDGAMFGKAAPKEAKELADNGIAIADCGNSISGQNQPGTQTPAYWKTHPDAWPVNTVIIGGVTYTKDDAIALMNEASAQAAIFTTGDMTIQLFQTLVAAKLNITIGNDATCVSDAIDMADVWLATHPVGSGVGATDLAWEAGEPLYDVLDYYNSGGLCAPSQSGEDHAIFLPLISSD